MRGSNSLVCCLLSEMDWQSSHLGAFPTSFVHMHFILFYLYSLTSFTFSIKHLKCVPCVHREIVSAYSNLWISMFCKLDIWVVSVLWDSLIWCALSSFSVLHYFYSLMIFSWNMNTCNTQTMLSLSLPLCVTVFQLILQAHCVLLFPPQCGM